MSISSGGTGRPALLLAGAGPGFGEAIIRGFVAAGYAAAGLSRSGSFGEALATALPGPAGYCHQVCDVTVPEETGRAVAAVAAALGPPRVAVYNPMRFQTAPFAATPPSEFEAVWRSGCLGAAVFAQAVLPPMLQAGSGTLILTGATASCRGGAGFAAFASAKFALRGLAQSLAREYGPQGIHVVHAVLDGLIWGPQAQARFSPRRESCLESEAVAQTYLHLAAQPRSAWTHELDLRPAGERF